MAYAFDAVRALMLRALGWGDLQSEMAGLPPADTKLKLSLEGRDPDEGLTDVAYEKGAAFLHTMERIVGRERFDAWLKGDDKALTDRELAGYGLFKESGCVACHNGPAVGGTSFQKMGLFEPYKTNNPAEGRAAVTGKDEDRMSFKVPTLRNVELTYPYFHDGEAATLEDAVDVMGRLQLGRKYSEAEIADIVAFLKALTGDQPTFVMPLLPPSSNDTPKPNPWE